MPESQNYQNHVRRLPLTYTVMALIVIANIVVDLLYVLLDPRVR